MAQRFKVGALNRSYENLRNTPLLRRIVFAPLVAKVLTFLKGAVVTTEKPKNLAEVLAKMNAVKTEKDSPEPGDLFEIGEAKFAKPKEASIPSQESSPDEEEPTVEKYTVEEDDETGDDKPVPPWVVFPPNFKVPAGRTVTFIRLRASWTDTPKKGDRVIIVWPITDAEEDAALERCRGKGFRVIPECTKAMIRAIDGKYPAWPGMRNIENESIPIQSFYRDIGAKCRALLETIYTQTHRLDQDDLIDFFRSCMATRTVILPITMRACPLIRLGWKPCLKTCYPITRS